jgi:hypothetical protein
MNSLESARFAQVLLIDAVRESVIERRLDVSKWEWGASVFLWERDCTRAALKAQAPAPAGKRLRTEQDRQILWKVYPMMRPDQSAEALQGRMNDTGRWVAFQQGYPPRLMRQQLDRAWRAAWVEAGLLAIAVLALILSLSR